MKKITILLSSVLLAASVNAQLFTDDFEGYAVGDYIGQASASWTTWSGAVGGAEDVQVTNAQASSGTNSIYFSSTDPNGGPQDVVLDFGQQYVDGIFTFESDIYIESGKNGYFNFQATPVIGTTWAMNCNMNNGIITLDDGVTTDLALGSYTDATWFTLRIEANLSTGRWQAFVDGVCIGVWANSVNTLASLDIFPLQNSGFYVDDVMFDHQAFVPMNLNAAISGVKMGSNIAGLNVIPTVTVVNAGITTITSFDVTIDYNGNQYVENVIGQNLTSLSSMDVIFTTQVPIVAGQLPVTTTVSNVNGGVDDDASDDSGCGEINPLVPAQGKVVVGEEGTGTWCPWCVRGTVFMDQYAADYGPYWIGIAVHNGDPMAVVDYDTGLGALISGYPSSVVDRGSDVDPSAMSTDFFTRLQIAPAAQMVTGATWDAGTRELNVSVTAVFDQAATNAYKMVCVLTEDGVTGTDSGYDQANAYAGGSNGPMGGFELLPSPVPASQMVYNHVARAITPSFSGDNTCFPALINAGDSVTNNYLFVLPADWDENEIHIVGMLVDPSAKIDNATKATITEAVANGFINGCSTASIVDMTAPQLDDVLKIYPNPATTTTTIEINVKQESDVQLSIIDMTGKQIASEDYGTISVASTVTLNTSNLNPGVYLVELTVNNQKTTKRLIVK